MPTYTPDELIKMMEPQARRDIALIGKCIDGLEIYAAQQAQAGHAQKVDEMRKLTEVLVCYWGLDDPAFTEPAKQPESYLASFDSLVADATVGVGFAGETPENKANTMYGLFRYGAEMVTAQGSDAVFDILSVSKLMKEIAASWDFESDVLDNMTGQLEAEVRRFAMRDKELINECIVGLGHYAAQQARDNYFSSKPEEIRGLVETLCSYWGLEDAAGDNIPPPDEILDKFDEQIHAAKHRKEVGFVSTEYEVGAVFGLYRYGDDMVMNMGNDAMSDILDVGDLMRDIAEYWKFDTYGVVEDLADRLRAEVRTMLGDITLPGQAVSGESNVGYQIRQAILFNNDRGFVLAHHPKAPAPYVTWMFTDRDGKRGYDVGHYFGTEERAKPDYISRTADYIEMYKVTEKSIIYRVPEVAVDLTDPSVTHTDMYAYGYSFEGMIPLGRERAPELYDKGREVFLLYEDSTEGAAGNRSDIEKFDGIFGAEDPAWTEADRPDSIEVFIVNRERQAKGENVGEWLKLPADADTLRGLFERIGMDRASEGAFTITAVRVPQYFLQDRITKYDSLDELNMLASFISDMEDFEIGKMQAILTSGVKDIGNGVTAVINSLCEENFDAFRMVDAKDFESLGRYWVEELHDKPEELSLEEYGKDIVADEKGEFTEWGYLYFRYKDLLPEYTGVVPDEYKIVGAAIRGLRSKTAEHGDSGEKASVVEKIRAARTASPKPRDNQKHNKSKGGQEL